LTGETLLVTAIKARQVEIVNFLLERGANPNIPDYDGRYPLKWAQKSGFDEGFIGHLKEKGAILYTDDDELSDILGFVTERFEKYKK
jgi:ankyrin repeat protein